MFENVFIKNSTEGNERELLFDKNTFEEIKEALKVEHKLSDVVLAVVNSSTILRCRPDVNHSSVNAQNSIKVFYCSIKFFRQFKFQILT